MWARVRRDRVNAYSRHVKAGREEPEGVDSRGTMDRTVEHQSIRPPCRRLRSLLTSLVHWHGHRGDRRRIPIPSPDPVNLLHGAHEDLSISYLSSTG